MFRAASPEPFADPPRRCAHVTVNVVVDGSANVLAQLAFRHRISLHLIANGGHQLQKSPMLCCRWECPVSIRVPSLRKEENHTSKAKADVMVRAASNANLSHENGLRTRCIRIPGFYGEGDKHMIISGLELA
jgi:nucleoside-diphosphate-sugar epimerase